MADNFTWEESASGIEFASDDVSGVHYQKVKLALGADGAVDEDLDPGQKTAAHSLPVVLASDHGAIPVEVSESTEGAFHVNQAFAAEAADVELKEAMSGKSIAIDGIIASSGEAGKWWLEQDTAGGKDVVFGPHWPGANSAFSAPVLAGPIVLAPGRNLGITSETTTKLSVDIFGSLVDPPAHALFRASSGASSASVVTSLVIPKPTGIEVGDLLIFFIYPEETSVHWSPQGVSMTLLEEVTAQYGAVSGRMYSRIAEASDVAGSGWTFGGGEEKKASGACVAYYDTDGVDVSDYGTCAEATTAVVSTQSPTTPNQAWVVSAMAGKIMDGEPATVTDPTFSSGIPVDDYAADYNTRSRTSHTMRWDQSATGDITFGFDATSRGVAFVVALKPPA